MMLDALFAWIHLKPAFWRAFFWSFFLPPLPDLNACHRDTEKTGNPMDLSI